MINVELLREHLMYISEDFKGCSIMYNRKAKNVEVTCKMLCGLSPTLMFNDDHEDEKDLADLIAGVYFDFK